MSSDKDKNINLDIIKYFACSTIPKTIKLEVQKKYKNSDCDNIEDALIEYLDEEYTLPSTETYHKTLTNLVSYYRFLGDTKEPTHKICKKLSHGVIPQTTIDEVEYEELERVLVKFVVNSIRSIGIETCDFWFNDIGPDDKKEILSISTDAIYDELDKLHDETGGNMPIECIKITTRGFFKVNELPPNEGFHDNIVFITQIHNEMLKEKTQTDRDYHRLKVKYKKLKNKFRKYQQRDMDIKTSSLEPIRHRSSTSNGNQSPSFEIKQLENSDSTEEDEKKSVGGLIQKFESNKTSNTVKPTKDDDDVESISSITFGSIED